MNNNLKFLTNLVKNIVDIRENINVNLLEDIIENNVVILLNDTINDMFIIIDILGKFSGRYHERLYNSNY